SWTCVAAGGSSCEEPDGGGNLDRSGDTVAAGGSLTYRFRVALGALGTDPLEVTGAAGSASDTASSALSPLRFTFSGPASYTPGTTANDGWPLVVSNTGDSTISDIVITTNFPAGIPTGAIDWRCRETGTGSNCGGSGTGSGGLSRSGDSVGADGSITCSFDVAFPSGMGLDPLAVSAGLRRDAPATTWTLATESGLDRQVDVSISKDNDGVSTYTPGQASSWNVELTNDGPSDADGVLVTDNAPAGMAIGPWSCEADGGARCGNGAATDTGSGNIAETVDIPAGGSVRFAISGSHASSTLVDPI